MTCAKRPSGHARRLAAGLVKPSLEQQHWPEGGMTEFQNALREFLGLEPLSFGCHQAPPQEGQVRQGARDKNRADPTAA